MAHRRLMRACSLLAHSTLAPAIQTDATHVFTCMAAAPMSSTLSAWRSVHSSATTAKPQPGGYMRTGESPDSGERLLVTGASGQVGSEFIPYLRDRLGEGAVVASDVKLNRQLLEFGPFVYCDVTDKDNLARIILENGITTIVHLATLLSAIGERNPSLALRVNTQGIQNVLELASLHKLRVYSPSTIAVFGPSTPRFDTPDLTVCRPTTMYGITKVHQELLGDYYHAKFDVDYRSLRYPGVISYNSMPGGGTTDYAVEIFHAALTRGRYECFLAGDAKLPFIYMPDCLDATFQLMTAAANQLTQRTYNVTAMSFTPVELYEAIKAEIPSFVMDIHPDFRDKIAKTWPVSIDDSQARKDWAWNPKYDLQAMTREMLDILSDRLGGGGQGAGRPVSAASVGSAMGMQQVVGHA